jgi:Ni/Fe-hydrogenase 1 B-type cytochrome subunit
LFFKKEHTLHIGHNAVAQLTYFIIIWLGSFFMIITGLAMQGEMLPGGLRGRWTGWMIHFFAGQSYEVRSWHHLIAWLFVGFIVVHLYMVIRQDILDDDSTVSAIINGHKFVIVEGENADEPK